MAASSPRRNFSQAELTAEPGDNPLYRSVCGEQFVAVMPTAYRLGPAGAPGTFSLPVASDRYGLGSSTRIPGGDDVIAWLPVAVLTAGKVILRLISLVALVWQERVHARSNCAQMYTAAVSGVILCERRRDGATLLIIPLSALSQGQGSAAGIVKRSSQVKPPP